MVKTRQSKKESRTKEDTRVTSRKKNDDDGGNKGNGPEIDDVQFREILAQIFPSSFADEQVELAKKRKNSANLSSGKKRKIRKRKVDSDVSSEETSDEESDDDVEQVSEPKKSHKNKRNTSLFTVFTISPKGKLKNTKLSRRNQRESSEEEEEPECSHSSSDASSAQDNGSDSDSVSTEELECEDDTLAEMFGGKDYDPEEDSDYSDEDEDYPPAKCSDSSSGSDDTQDSPSQLRRSKRLAAKNEKGEKSVAKDIPPINLEEFESGLQTKLDGVPPAFQSKCKSLWHSFKQKLEKERKSFVQNAKKEEKKQRKGNLGQFRKMLREGDVMNDLKYFNRVMSVDEQKAALAEMEKVKAFSTCDKPYRLRLLEAPIPSQVKAIALKKINALRYTAPGDSEYNKLKKWVDAFLQIPFGKHSDLSLSLTDGQSKCHDFMNNAKAILDDAVYGLDDAKLQIIQMLGQWISNPTAIGSALAIHGPMGTGKTTLVKEGISKILGREFIFIALGGATDSSFLEGHSYTYEGSTWGKIIDAIMQCKTMNPIIYFDELDKVSDTPRGEEIIGILTHLTDTSQNDKFHDKYFNEVEFDLSKCLFIFSYNDPERVNPILRDRMYTIKTNGYTNTQKVTIAEKHLIPKLMPQVGFKPDEVTIPSETVSYITREYTSEEEKGVRSLKRRLEIIFTKLNLYRLLKPGTEMFGQKIPDAVEFPMTVTPELVQDLLKKEEKDTKHWVMYS